MHPASAEQGLRVGDHVHYHSPLAGRAGQGELNHRAPLVDSLHTYVWFARIQFSSTTKSRHSVHFRGETLVTSVASLIPIISVNQVQSNHPPKSQGHKSTKQSRDSETVKEPQGFVGSQNHTLPSSFSELDTCLMTHQHKQSGGRRAGWHWRR